MTLRPLTDRETSVLGFLLSVECPGIMELRNQARHVMVDDDLSPDPSVNLAVDQTAATVVPGAPHIDIGTENDFGLDGSDFVQVTLFIREGWLSAINLAWNTKFALRVAVAVESEKAATVRIELSGTFRDCVMELRVSRTCFSAS